jgi:hypothetical protein
MASVSRQEFAKKRKVLLAQTASGQFICARCGRFSKSVNLHHITELIDGGSNDNRNLIPLCEDCHIEWDTCADLGMELGEFLVSLSPTTWQMATMTGLFRSPHAIGEALIGIYKMQFAGSALRYTVIKNQNGACFDYWNELKRQNEMFPSYPYSNHDKMIKLYGSMYETLSQESFAEYAQERLEEIKARKTAP